MTSKNIPKLNVNVDSFKTSKSNQNEGGSELKQSSDNAAPEGRVFPDHSYSLLEGSQRVDGIDPADGLKL